MGGKGLLDLIGETGEERLMKDLYGQKGLIDYTLYSTISCNNLLQKLYTQIVFNKNVKLLK
jgi:hypothetical protein